jgi:hypothetical protein
MGIKVQVNALIDMPPDIFWKLRNTPEYLAVECEVLKFKTKECVDVVLDDRGMPRPCYSTKRNCTFLCHLTVVHPISMHMTLTLLMRPHVPDSPSRQYAELPVSRAARPQQGAPRRAQGCRER